MTATKNHYAFRGRLISLLVLTHCGVSSRPQLPQDKEGFLENHRTQKKRFSFSRSRRVFLRWWSSYLVPVITITDTMLVWRGGPLTMRVYLRLFHTCIKLDLCPCCGYCFPCRHPRSAGG